MTPEPDPHAASHAVLIGVSAYEDPAFPPVRAARNSLEAMRATLADPKLCGWPAQRITVITNPVSAEALAMQLAQIAESTTGVLLVYYVGHGVLTPRGELCLTVTSTVAARPKITAMTWASVSEILDTASCPARVRVAILDCCFAGQAVSENLAGDPEATLADVVHVEGVYTLTATTRNRTAHVVPENQQDQAATSFTSELIDLVREGLPGRPEWLTLGEIYPVLRHRLQAKNLPLPNQRGTDTAERFLFTANAAHASRSLAGARPAEPAPASRPARAPATGVAPPAAQMTANQKHATEVFDVAVRAAYAVSGDADRASRLAYIAGKLAWVDLRRATTLLQSAEAAAPPNASVSGDLDVARAKSEIARVLVATDPEQAERLANRITDDYQRGRALALLAESFAATDRVRAEKTALDIPNGFTRVHTLVMIAEITTALCLDSAHLLATAEHWARKIIDGRQKTRSLSEIARAVAATDSDQAARLLGEAERTALAVGNTVDRAKALTEMARALSTTDPDRAGRRLSDALNLLQVAPRKSVLGGTTIIVERTNSIREGLCFVATTLAETDPRAAMGIVATVDDDVTRVRVTNEIARMVAGKDAVYAEILRHDAEMRAKNLPSGMTKTRLLIALAEGFVSTEPDRALKLLQDAEEGSRALSNDGERAKALADVGFMWTEI